LAVVALVLAAIAGFALLILAIGAAIFAVRLWRAGAPEELLDDPVDGEEDYPTADTEAGGHGCELRRRGEDRAPVLQA
jgi:hypothetical protein